MTLSTWRPGAVAHVLHAEGRGPGLPGCICIRAASLKEACPVQPHCDGRPGPEKPGSSFFVSERAQACRSPMSALGEGRVLGCSAPGKTQPGAARLVVSSAVAQGELLVVCLCCRTLPDCQQRLVCLFSISKVSGTGPRTTGRAAGQCTQRCIHSMHIALIALKLFCEL